MGLSRCLAALIHCLGLTLFLTTAGAAPVSPLDSEAPPRYRLTDLGVADVSAKVGHKGRAIALNDLGQVVGSGGAWRRPPFPPIPWLGQRHGFGVLHATSASYTVEITALNDRDEVVGYARFVGNDAMLNFGDEPFLWERGRMHWLSTPSGNSGDANAINNRGEVAGWSRQNTYIDPDAAHALAWAGGRVYDLGVGVATALNDEGDVVGVTANDDAHTAVNHALLWHHGRRVDLGALGGDISEAYAINDSGLVVGDSETISMVTHAVEWRGGRILDLDSGSGAESHAEGVNGAGEVVGRAVLAGGQVQRACLWYHLRGYDLDGLLVGAGGWHLEDAHQINARGQIIGYAVYQGIGHSVLLTPLGTGRQMIRGRSGRHAAGLVNLVRP